MDKHTKVSLPEPDEHTLYTHYILGSTNMVSWKPVKGWRIDRDRLGNMSVSTPFGVQPTAKQAKKIGLAFLAAASFPEWERGKPPPGFPREIPEVEG